MALAYHAKQDGSTLVLTGRLRHLKPVLLFRLIHDVCIGILIDWYDSSRSLSVRGDGFISCFQSSSWRLFTAVPWSFLISGSTAQRRPANVSVCVFSQITHCVPHSRPHSKGLVVLLAWSDLLLCLSTFSLASKNDALFLNNIQCLSNAFFFSTRTN